MKNIYFFVFFSDEKIKRNKNKFEELFLFANKTTTTEYKNNTENIVGLKYIPLNNEAVKNDSMEKPLAYIMMNK